MDQKTKHLATIELNGQKYDARSGTRLISNTPGPAVIFSDVTPANQAVHTARALKPSKHVHMAPQRGQTLMRRAVKKPAVARIGSALVSVEAPLNLETSETMVNLRRQDDIIRSKRSVEVPKSSLVSRFSDLQVIGTPVHHNSDTVTKHLAQMDVVPAPVHHEPTESRNITLQNHYKNTSEKLITAGLSKSHSHETPKHKKPKLHRRVARRLGFGRRATNLLAGGLTVLLLGAFVAYQRVPNLAVRYASMKAGVNANLPGYHPAAFAVNDAVKYSPGEVAVSYKSNTDDRSYTVTQKNTSWDNSTLEQHLREEAGKMPQSFAQDNNTIYIQDMGTIVQASVIKNGVLKNISGDASLNTDQIIKIARSM